MNSRTSTALSEQAKANIAKVRKLFNEPHLTTRKLFSMQVRNEWARGPDGDYFQSLVEEHVNALIWFTGFAQSDPVNGPCEHEAIWYSDLDGFKVFTWGGVPKSTEGIFYLVSDTRQIEAGYLRDLTSFVYRDSTDRLTLECSGTIG